MDRSVSRAEAESSYSSLVVKVADRDALPVRAIPYATGWTISPDVVAREFARQSGPFQGMENTDTYHLVDGVPTKLLPKEWDRYVAAVQGLEAELREQFASNEQGYAAWLSKSVAKLPAGVFVWLDEFTTDFEHDYGPERLSMMDEREGDRKLSLSPFLEDDALNMALEGFERRRPLSTNASDDSHAGLVEFLQNGRLIDWRYWVESMPTLSPAEATRLMEGLDPEIYEGMNSRPLPKYDATNAWNAVKRMERLAAVEKVDRLSPEGWYRWAVERGFSVHRGFFLASYGRHLRENEAQVLASMPRNEASRWERGQALGNGQRLVSLKYARHVTDVSMTFPDFVAEVEERCARWRRGRYELIEAAQVLADETGMDAGQLAEQMDVAVHAGKLVYRVNNIRVEPERIPNEHLWHRVLFEDDVNAWLALEAADPHLRLAYPYEEEAPSETSDSSTPEAGAEHTEGWELWLEVDRLTTEIDTWQKAKAESVSELQAKEDRVSTLKARLDELHATLSPIKTGASPSDSALKPISEQARAEQRQDRRLSRFQELGGRMKKVPGAWNVDTVNGTRGALAALVKEEKSAKHPRSDRKDVTTDLQVAMERFGRTEG